MSEFITYSDIEVFLTQNNMTWDDLAEAVGLKLNRNQYKYQAVPKKVSKVIGEFIETYQLKEEMPSVDLTLEQLEIYISVCESGVTNTSLKQLCITPQRLANKLKQVKVGSKDGSYFVRYNGTIRNDKAAPDTAYVLILDGDSRITSDGEIVAPAPDPALVSEILANHRVNHVIYSSYSNGEKGEDYFKYRVIIFIRYNHEQLPVLLNHFHELLHDEGCLLFNVKENRSFSQPWFFPRCPAERLHLFKFYEFLEGNEQDANAICSAYEAAHPTIQPEPIYRPAPVKNDYTGLKISPIQLFNEHWKSPVYYLQSQGYRYFGSRLLPPHCRDSSIAGVQVCQQCVDSSTPLTWINGDDAAINAKAPDFMINDILESDSHGILFGASMTYKTFIALSLAYSICTGSNFFKHQVFKKGKVLYICGEGKIALSRRLLAIRLTFGDFNGNLFILHDCISIDNGIDMIRLKNAIDEIKPVLVIIDTFSSLVSDTDENSNSEVAKTLKGVARTCSNGITSSLLLHHSGKDSNAGARGAYAFKGNTDYMFEATRTGDSMITTLHCRKQKDGEDFAPINIKAEIVELTGLARQDGKITTSLVLKSTDETPKTEKTGDSLDKLDTDILASLGKAIAEKGFSPTQEIIDYFSNNPQNCPKNIIELDDFRPFAYPFLTVAENSKRNTLKRRIDKLIKLNKCMFYSDYLWIIDQRNTVT